MYSYYFLSFSLLHLKGSRSLTAAVNLRALCFPCSDNLLLLATGSLSSVCSLNTNIFLGGNNFRKDPQYCTLQGLPCPSTFPITVWTSSCCFLSGFFPYLLSYLLTHFVSNINMPVLQTAFAKTRMERGKLHKVIAYFPEALRSSGSGWFWFE